MKAIAFIRSIAFMLFMTITIIPWSTYIVLQRPFTSKSTTHKICVAWLALMVKAAGPILGIKNKIIGLQNIPKPEQGAAVILIKHQSLWETFTMPAIIPRPIAYVFKQELLKVPFFGWAIGSMDMIHIDRKQGLNALRKIEKEGKRLIAQNTCIALFPEGTRIPRGQTGTYMNSGARLAINTGVPIIPVAVTSAKCWPAGQFIKTSGTVDIHIGEPIPSEGKKPDELTKQAQNWIENKMRELDPEAYK